MVKYRDINDNIIISVTPFVINLNVVEIIEVHHNLDALWCRWNKIEHVSLDIIHGLEILFCQYNNIQKLPDLRQCKELRLIGCDLITFEPYMLDLDISFEFYC